MKLTVLCVALAGWPAFGAVPESGLVSVALYTQFEHQPSRSVERAIKRELESIMTPMGVQFEWRSLKEVKGNEVSVELAVITFKGRCDLNGLQPVSVNPGALGWTHISDGIILPFTDVDCTRIRSFVQRDLLSEAAGARDQIFGRAVARVLAHELYHIFTKTTHHGAFGVAKSAYSVRELLCDDFQFEGRDTKLLKESQVRIARAATGE